MKKSPLADPKEMTRTTDLGAHDFQTKYESSDNQFKVRTLFSHTNRDLIEIEANSAKVSLDIGFNNNPSWLSMKITPQSESRELKLEGDIKRQCENMHRFMATNGFKNPLVKGLLCNSDNVDVVLKNHGYTINNK